MRVAQAPRSRPEVSLPTNRWLIALAHCGQIKPEQQKMSCVISTGAESSVAELCLWLTSIYFSIAPMYYQRSLCICSGLFAVALSLTNLPISIAKSDAPVSQSAADLGGSSTASCHSTTTATQPASNAELLPVPEAPPLGSTNPDRLGLSLGCATGPNPAPIWPAVDIRLIPEKSCQQRNRLALVCLPLE